MTLADSRFYPNFLTAPLLPSSSVHAAIFSLKAIPQLRFVALRCIRAKMRWRGQATPTNIIISCGVYSRAVFIKLVHVVEGGVFSGKYGNCFPVNVLWLHS